MTALLHKQVAAEATVTDLGEFEAIASAWSVDRQGEQVKRGAFARTIAAWIGTGRQIPLHWNHSGEASDIIGTVDPKSMRETRQGLKVKGKLDLEASEVAREAWRSMKADAVGLSFGFLVTKDSERADGVRVLDEVDLFEISITPAPANPDTRILGLKSAEGSDPVAADEDAERLRTIAAMSNDELLRELGVRKKRGPIRLRRFEL